MKIFGLHLLRARFDDPTTFVRALGEGEDAAIEHLFAKIVRPVERLAKQAGLPRQESEEALNDVAVIFIQKIRDGSYRLTDAPPHTYALGVARWALKNRAARDRNRRISSVELEKVALSRPDETAAGHFSRQDDAALVGALLGQLSEKCQLLIRLRYFEGVPDEEVVRRKLTPFTTVDSLKNRRKECLQKLRAIARGIAPDFFVE